MFNILTLITFLPIIFAIVCLIFSAHASCARFIAVIASTICLVLSIFLFIKFDSTSGVLQFALNYPWINSLNIRYFIGVDGISLPFIVLNNFITFVVILAGFKLIKHKVALYNAMFLMMTGFISGSFIAQDAILFYVFFEAMLIPMYLIIGVWGGTNRIYAAFKFFLYTLLGSLLMLIALIYLHSLTHSFALNNFYLVKLSFTVQILLFIAFFLSFAVKVPMWPLHTWLPDAHPEAPTGGSMVLAAVTLKIGGYGFLRFILPIVPDASHYLAPLMITLSLIAIVYIGLVAIVQKDMKKLIAYSSISHMGFVTLGCFLFVGYNLNKWGVTGAIMQMISHGFISAAMFMCIGVIYERIHSRNIADYGGVVHSMPKFAVFFMLFAMANSGLPGTSGFAGEFMVIMGAVQTNFVVAFIACLTLILGAGYTLWMYKRVVFGPVINTKVSVMADLDCIEFSVLFLLALATLVFGICPNLMLSKLQVTIDAWLPLVAKSKLF